jgi:hypothetical protein
MSREVKRVPMDFDWPQREVWPGYQMSACNSKCNGECRIFARLVGKEVAEGDCPDFSIPVPEGDGWQMWETVSEGSPISPVFATPEELARWLADTGASAFATMTATYDQWLATIRVGFSVSAMFSPGVGLASGVEANALL